MSSFSGGVFSISGVGLPYVSGTVIASTVANQLNTDLATGLSTTICKDGQSTTTALIPFSLGITTDILSPYTANGPVSVTAGQLKFPATQNPSSNANTLDDYEEGLWTPIDSSGGGLTFTSFGDYIKLGQVVNFSGVVLFPVTVDANAIIIGGLPFTSSSVLSGASYGAYFTQVDTSRNDFLIVNRNATTLGCYAPNGTQPINSQYSAKTIRFCGWYRASA